MCTSVKVIFRFEPACSKLFIDLAIFDFFTLFIKEGAV